MNQMERIRQVAQVKRMMRRWLSLSRGADAAGYVDLREKAHGSVDGVSSARVPAGHLAVYVGAQRERFVIPTRFLNLPVFAALLRMAAEEYGYSASGGLAIPCDPGFFRRLVGELERNGAGGRFSSLGLDAYLDRFADDLDGGVASPCQESIAPGGVLAHLRSKTNA